jgi:hypothetical protein
MRKTILVISAFLLTVAAAPAADPRIVGAEQPVPLGELVTLSVPPPEKKDGLTQVTYDWSVVEWDGNKKNFVPKRVKADAEGNVFFGAGIVAKKVLAHVAVTYVYQVKDKDGKVTSLKTDTLLLSAVVTIGDGSPDGPPPPPPDDPKPADTEPDFGAGKWAPLSKLAWKSAKGVDPSARPAAKALAAAFRGVAGKVGKDLKGPKAILAAAVQANDAALGDAKDGWKTWSDSLSDALYKLANAGQLVTDADYQAAFSAVADGLDKVK